MSAPKRWTVTDELGEAVTSFDNRGDALDYVDGRPELDVVVETDYSRLSGQQLRAEARRRERRPTI